MNFYSHAKFLFLLTCKILDANLSNRFYFFLKLKEKMFSNPDFDGTVQYAPKFGHRIA